MTYSFSQYTLSGKLTDNNGEALIGATVKIASLSLATSTDLEGIIQFPIFLMVNIT